MPRRSNALDGQLENPAVTETPRIVRVSLRPNESGITKAELLRPGIALYEVTKEQVDAELVAMDRLGIPG